ncbi:MAG: metalloprotease PmbA [Gammaproteobacteria bacterium]|nr:metalloprotease PmbA [Gammaproteobacteria bacterium]
MTDTNQVEDAIELHSDGIEAELTQLVERLLDEARKQGAHEATASVSDSISVEVSARARDIENVAYEQGRVFHVNVNVDHREGTAVTSDVSDAAIKETVAQAMSIARYTEPDPCNGLPAKDRLTFEFKDLAQNYPTAVNMDRLKADALAADAAALDYDQCIMPAHGADASQMATCGVRGNSLGFVCATRHTGYGRSATAIAKSDAGMQSDYWFDRDCHPDKIESAESIGREASRRAKRRLDPKPIRTGTYPVMYDRWIAPSLLYPLIEGISGGNLYRQETYLEDSLGKQVASQKLTLREYPHIQGRSQSRNCDADGVTTEEHTIIDNGVVDTYLLGTYSGRRLDMRSTGHAGGITNVHVETDFAPLQDLLHEMKEGLLVTSLIGSGTNLVTGDYSCGAAGFWIENGEIAYPVDNVTIASNLDAMYKGIVGFADDIQDRSSIRTGAILVDAMTVASN